MQKTFAARNDEIKAIKIALILCLFASGYLFYEGKALSATVVLILMSLLGLHRIWGLLRSAVSVDEAGIWLSKQGKAKTFVTWEQIAHLKIDRSHNHLVLLDKQFNTQLKIIPVLDNLHELCTIVLDRSAVTLNIKKSQQLFIRTTHRLFYICAFIMNITIGAMVYFIPRSDSCCTNHAGNVTQDCVNLSPELAATLITTLLMALLLFAFHGSIYRIIIGDNTIELFSPFKRKVIPFQSITNLQMNSFQQVILMASTQKKPLPVPALDTDALTLYCCLKHAMEKNPNDHERKTD